jgi:hypothetical protein
MTRKDKRQRPTPDRLTEELVEDILAASAADLLVEAEADADQGAVKARAAFQRACRAAALRRVSGNRHSARPRKPPMDIRALDPETARGWLADFVAGNPEAAGRFAAADNSKTLSDEDVYGMLERLQEGGVLKRGGLEHDRR